MNNSKKERRGISVRVVHAAMLVCAVAIVALLVISTRRTSSIFSELNTETGNYIVRQKAAYDLMEASDYLTENVQRFTVEGDTKYLDQYFEEAFTSKRRESAVITMSDNHADAAMIQQLNEALNESQTLMYREYYAMKLAAEAYGIHSYPDVVKAIELSEEDEFLPAEEKIKLAQDMVMGSEYYEKKVIIRTKLKSSLEMMEDQMSRTRKETNADMMREISVDRTMVIILIVVLAALIILTAFLSTIPLITASRTARKGERLPETIGSSEFRELSKRYNEMHEALYPEKEE